MNLIKSSSPRLSGGHYCSELLLPDHHNVLDQRGCCESRQQSVMSPGSLRTGVIERRDPGRRRWPRRLRLFFVLFTRQGVTCPATALLTEAAKCETTVVDAEMRHQKLHPTLFFLFVFFTGNCKHLSVRLHVINSFHIVVTISACCVLANLNSWFLPLKDICIGLLFFIHSTWNIHKTIQYHEKVRKCVMFEGRVHVNCSVMDVWTFLSSPKSGGSEQERTKKKRRGDRYSVQTSLIVAALKKLLPIGLNMCSPADQELINLAKIRYSLVLGCVCG